MDGQFTVPDKILHLRKNDRFTLHLLGRLEPRIQEMGL